MAKKNQTHAVAFGGVISAMSVVLMLLTGLFPFAEYTLPALAGILLIAVVIEYGYKRALLCYAVVAVLSLLIVPSKEAAVMFAGFFGYYPILKGKLEGFKKRPLEWAFKFGLFNIAAVLSYLAAIYLFGLTGLLEDLGAFGKWGPVILLAAGNVAFLILDLAMTRLIAFYYHYLQPKFLKKLNLH